SPSQFRAGHHPLHSPEATMTTTMTPHEVRIERVPPRRVAFLRHVGPYQAVGPSFQRLAGWAGRRGLFGPHTLMLGVCHDDPEVTPPDKVRYDCCVTVGDGVQGEGEVGVRTLEGGECAVVTHRGPYETLGEAYRWVY